MLGNTETAWGSVTRCLHWLMAAWIVTAYTVIIYLTWGHTEGLIPGLNYHKAIGFAILVPFAFRLAWRLCNPAPALPPGMPPWQVRLSKLTHVLVALHAGAALFHHLVKKDDVLRRMWKEGPVPSTPTTL